MGIQFSGSPTSALIAADTKALMLSNLQTQFVAAGWSTVGSPTASDVTLKSPATSQGSAFSCRVRLQDTAATSLLCTFSSGDGLRTGSTVYMAVGAGKQYRAIITPATFFVFVPGSTAAREFVSGGVCYVPTQLLPSITESLWCMGSGINDSSGGSTTFRTSLTTRTGGTAGPNTAILNATVMAHSGPGNLGAGQLQFWTWGPGYLSDANGNGFRWATGEFVIVDAMLMAGTTSLGEGKLIGQAYDCFICSESFLADLTLTIDGKTYMAITSSNGGSATLQRGTLFARIA